MNGYQPFDNPFERYQDRWEFEPAVELSPELALVGEPGYVAKQVNATVEGAGNMLASLFTLGAIAVEEVAPYSGEATILPFIPRAEEAVFADVPKEPITSTTPVVSRIGALSIADANRAFDFSSYPVAA
jgi:hypothetical protein